MPAGVYLTFAESVEKVTYPNERNHPDFSELDASTWIQSTSLYDLTSAFRDVGGIPWIQWANDDAMNKWEAVGRMERDLQVDDIDGIGVVAHHCHF